MIASHLIKSLKFLQKYIPIFGLITIGLSSHYFILLRDVKSLIDDQGITISHNCRATPTPAVQQYCPSTSNLETSKLLLHKAITGGEPFDYLLTSPNMSKDQHLFETAQSGIATSQALQYEFIIKLLPMLQNSNSIPIKNKLISHWIKIRKKDIDSENQINKLTKELSLQNFTSVVQIIDDLPETPHLILYNWRKKIMDYIYAQEFLKIYLNDQND